MDDVLKLINDACKVINKNRSHYVTQICVPEWFFDKIKESLIYENERYRLPNYNIEIVDDSFGVYYSDLCLIKYNDEKIETVRINYV